ncbi:MAG: HAD-IA family hydrolase [Candidatus Planktophila sp.]|nr:HAD-IA family hydrolase [Candidatus Planktophila sp.]
MDLSHSIEQTPCELTFDLDGTLTDPALGFVRSVNFSLESHGISPVEEDDLKKFIGPPLDGAFREILHLDQDKDFSSFVSKYRERYSEVGFSENILYDGIPDVLVTLRRLGFRMGVCTSKRVDFAERILTLFDIRQYFEFVNGAEVGIKKSSQLKELTNQNFVNSRSIMIGDRHVDIEAAKANSMRSVGVLYGYGSKQEIENTYPEWIAIEPKALLNIFVDLSVMDAK